jgi:Protein of unknown function (DUF998)
MTQTVMGSAIRTQTHTLLLATGFGSLLFMVTYLILGALAPNYRPAHDTISALEFTTLSVAQRVNFSVFGLLLCAFALGLRLELPSGRGARLIPLFQLFAGIGVIGDALFIHDPLHFLCDLIAFNSGLVVLFLFAWRFRSDIRWKGWDIYSIATALLMMGFLTAFGIANHAGGPAGAMEKLATATRTLWSALLTTKLLAGARLDPYA